MNAAAPLSEGAEIENFGKDSTGSYPISVTGASAAPTDHTADGDIAFNTIHHSFNHGIALGASGDYSLAYPANMNQLAYLKGGRADRSVQPFIAPEDGISFPMILTSPSTQQFPHNGDSNSNGNCAFN